MKSNHKKNLASVLLSLVTLTSFLSRAHAEDQLQENNLAAQLLFQNGDILSGSPSTLDKENNISFLSDIFRKPTSFLLSEIIALKLDNAEESTLAADSARIEIQNRYNQEQGDIIIGQLQELTPEHIILNTAYAGIIQIERPMVKSFKIIPKDPGHYYGPNHKNEWSSESPDSDWSFKNGTLTTNSSNLIGMDVGMRPNSYISFHCDHGSNMNFSLRLFSSDPISENPDAACTMIVSRSSASIRATNNIIKNNAVRATTRQRINIENIENTSHFEIFTNAELGLVHLYIDGVQACNLRIGALELQQLGTGLSFESSTNTKFSISDIVVNPWDGMTLPQATDAEISAQPHHITLINGDLVPGTVAKVEDGHMVVDTEYTAIRIPLNKIKSLNLGKDGDQPIMKSGDIRVSLHNGSHMVFRLDELTETHISGYGQAIGDIKLKLSAVDRIDFNIYDHEMTPIRETTY
ncbi:MAG: hypothetical protein ACSHX0_09575 [Akkermansiaceae bacterium]